MALSLDGIISAALLMAFILPAFVLIDNTLPIPANAIYNQTANLTSTGILIATRFNSTIQNVNSLLLGSNTGFNANPTIFQAYAFIINGLGTIMLDIVQLPYLDELSFQVIITGMSSVLPGIPLGFVIAGVYLLYAYMGLTILLLGVSMLEKYNVREG